MKRLAAIIVCAVAAAMAAAEERNAAAYDVWRQPSLWPEHLRLRGEFFSAVRRGDAKGMETAARAGIELMPDDPVWRYNHACSLARGATPAAALDELDKAVKYGFRDADAIERDSDFGSVAKLARFRELVEKARSLAGKPVEGRPAAAVAAVGFGGTVELSSSNVVWNMDTGFFETTIGFTGENNPSACADRYGQTRPNPAGCPEREYMAAWLSEGTASGNGGDLYVNRDRRHSMLEVRDFPLLTSVVYPAESRQNELDTGLPNLMFAGRPFVFGNASRAIVSGPMWRSFARAAMSDPQSAMRMHLMYFGNQFWVFPAHKDFGKPGIGDVFPARVPFIMATVGSSYTDKPYLRAAVAAAAAFPRPTRQALLRRGLLAPTLQKILRRTLKGVSDENAYLTPRAHPVAFAAADLDVVAAVKCAHAMRPEQIPPAPVIALVNSRMFPVKMPLPVRDYPDPLGELFFATPSAVSFILRGLDAERQFIFKAGTYPEADPTAEYAWRVVGGDESLVKIGPPLGETLAGPSTGLAQLTIDRRNLTNRLDIAVFARSHGTQWSAPAFVSFMPVPFEKRLYDARGRLVSIDNSNPEGVYTDPAIALPRAWKDLFAYDAEGRLSGYVRTIGGKKVAEFTATGERILERGADGKPSKTVPVRYIMRKTTGAGAASALPPELTYLDDPAGGSGL